MQTNRIQEKKIQQQKDANMEVSETETIHQESESMDFSSTTEPESVKTVETEPMQTANLKPRYSYKWVDSWPRIHMNAWLSWITL